MTRHLIIAPLSLLVVMVLYLIMHGLLHQQQTIEFKENESEFVFSPFEPTVATDFGRPLICKAGKHTLTKAELWQKTKNVLSNKSAIISCPGYVSLISNYSNVQDVSKAILNELIPNDPFIAFERNKTNPKPPYNQKLTLSWLPSVQYPPHTRVSEGWVELEILVNAQGTVDDIHVIAANPPRVFDRTAIQTYKKAKFLPEIVNGKAIAKTIIQRINFKLAED